MRRPPVSDIVLAMSGLVATVVEASLAEHYGWSWYVIVLVLVHAGLSGALLVRHTWRRTSFVATYLLLAALAAVIAVVPYNLGVSPMILCAPLSLYVVARHEPYRWGTAALLLGVAGTFVSPLHRLPGGLPTFWVPAMVLVLLGVYLWATGRRRTEVAYQRQLDAALAEREREASFRVAQAQADERARIARELHDIVAHSLAVVQVQASTGLALGTADAQRDALGNVRDASRAALAEVRSMVRGLRDAPTAGASDATLPGGPAAGATSAEADLTAVSGDLSRLRRLARTARDAGVDLDAHLPDDATLAAWQDAWPASVRLTVLRVVQEGLTNVLKHGGDRPRARLGVAASGERVRVEIANDRRASGGEPGYGLLGLRERVTLAGGVLEAGPDADGFRLTATIPVPQASGSPARPRPEEAR